MFRDSWSLSLPFTGCIRRSELLMRPPTPQSWRLDVPRRERVAPAFELIVVARRAMRNGLVGVDLRLPRESRTRRNPQMNQIDECAPRDHAGRVKIRHTQEYARLTGPEN
jgi:hypothetical protein